MDPSALYSKSVSSYLAYLFVSPSGEWILVPRAEGEPGFPGFLGFPVIRAQAGAASWDRPNLLNALSQVFSQEDVDALAGGTETAVGVLEATPLPPLTPHVGTLQLLTVRLPDRRPPTKGEWHPPEALASLSASGTVLLEPTVLAALRSSRLPAGIGRSHARDARLPLLGPDTSFVPEHAFLWIRPNLKFLPLRSPTLPPATHTNCCIFGTRRLLVIDPASPFRSEQARLEKALQSLVDAGATLEGVLLTHHHPDHVAGAMAVKRKFGIPIYAHARTVEALPKRITAVPCLEDGQQLRLEDQSLLICHTPGHAPGHICGYDLAYGTLIAGDLFAGWGTIVINPSEGDLGLYLDSLERMIAFEPSIVLPSHGPPVGQALAPLEKLLAHRHARSAQIVDALRSGAMGISELVAIIYRHYPLSARLMARGSVRAHLLHLEKTGVLAHQGRKYSLTP